jgi:beta-phosphoglucomutase-like phosphatase (HAD superfamily)
VLFDFGGVLTTSVWDSFAAFCRSEGLDSDAIKEPFRTDPQAIADLRGLETGAMSEAEFERSFGRRLGLEREEGLIDSMFEGMKPLEPMVAAVRDVRRGGLLTGLISNSWSTAHYDRELLGELFDEVVISAEVGLHKPQPEIYRLAAEPADPAACLSSTTCARTARGRGGRDDGRPPSRPADTIARLSAHGLAAQRLTAGSLSFAPPVDGHDVSSSFPIALRTSAHGQLVGAVAHRHEGASEGWPSTVPRTDEPRVRRTRPSPA